MSGRKPHSDSSRSTGDRGGETGNPEESRLRRRGFNVFESSVQHSRELVQQEQKDSGQQETDREEKLQSIANSLEKVKKGFLRATKEKKDMMKL